MKTAAEASHARFIARLDADADDPRYRLMLTRRATYLGRLQPAGCLVLEPELRTALRLVREGAARPADRRTALDVALGLALELAIPRPRC